MRRTHKLTNEPTLYFHIALSLITAVLVYTSVPSQAAALAIATDPVKINRLTGTSIPGDFTQKQASITRHWEGSAPDVVLQTFDPDPTTFMLGTGNTNFTHGALAGQYQESSWSIRGLFNADKNNTTFIRENNPDLTGFFTSVARLEIEKGTSLAKTTFAVSGGFNGGTVKITGDNTKDDAFAESDSGTVAHSRGSLIFTLDGTIVLDVETVLEGQFGGAASIVDAGPNAGLTLLAIPGQIAAMSVTATNEEDSTQTFSWSAIFNGLGRTLTTASGVIDPGSFFISIAGGWFLPFDAMPGHDLTADLGSGELTFTGVASADIASVAESSTLLYLSAGLAVLSWCACRRPTQSLQPQAENNRSLKKR